MPQNQLSFWSDGRIIRGVDKFTIKGGNPDYYKNSDYWREPFDWHATSIRAILNNCVYLGHVVFGRTKTKGFFEKTRIAVPEEDWIIVEGTHEPLVSQELWDTVHQAMKARRR